MTWEQQHLALAYYIHRDCPEFLSDSMVRALVKHGYRQSLSADVVAKFADVLKEADNPNRKLNPVPE